MMILEKWQLQLRGRITMRESVLEVEGSILGDKLYLFAFYFQMDPPYFLYHILGG